MALGTGTNCALRIYVHYY